MSSQLTADAPSKNSSGWMPILDIQVKIKADKIVYKFFKKKVSTPFVILANSALPTKIKRASLVQEAVRRLLNTRRNTDWDIKAEILTEFSYSLMISGYSEKWRLDTMKSAINGYNKKCAQADAGIRPLHWPRSFETEKRRQEKLMSTTSWYRPHNAVGFYPSTPNQELAQKIHAFVD